MGSPYVDSLINVRVFVLDWVSVPLAVLNRCENEELM